MVLEGGLKVRKEGRSFHPQSGVSYSSPTASSLKASVKASVNVRRARYALIMSLSRSETLSVALAST